MAKRARRKSNSVKLTRREDQPESKAIETKEAYSRDDSSTPAAAAPAKAAEDPESAIETVAARALAGSQASNEDIAVGTTAIHDMLTFFTGDPKIADYKLKYIAETAGLGDVDLKGKKWSFANDGSAYRFYIYPETLEEAFQSIGDFAMKKTYGSLSNVLMKLPKVEIRSFAQRTLLQSIADRVGTATDDIANAAGGALKALWNGELMKSTKEEFKKVTENLKKIWDAESKKDDSLFGKLIAGITPGSFKGGDHAALLNLPFIFYYCLASSVTRCYFSLPLDSRSYENLWASTTQGWMSSRESTMVGKVEAFSGLDDLGLTSILTTAITRSFGVQFMPSFNMSQINLRDEEGQIDLTFVLMNDTEEHANANITFLRVLFPSAMWSNVGVFAISGDLFDVKVKGAMRWLMCTGSFDCSPVGAIRTMYGSEMKIPDAYKVHCMFKSLVPNNLNNYLLGYLSDFTMTGRNSVLGQVYENIKNLF